MSLELRRESPDDAAAVRDVVTRAFDTDPVVADLWDALRERGSIGIVAVDDDGSVCGHVGLTWCWLDAPDRLVDVLVLSPLSVAPEAQRHGHARALLAAARATAEELGSPLLFLERPVDRGPQTVGDEVERRAPIHRQRRPRVVREHEDVVAVGRVLPPPAAPRVVRPRAPDRAEHVASHDGRADPLIAATEPRVVHAGRAALTAVRRLPHPEVQSLAADAERVLAALPGTGDEAVERHGR